MKIFNTIKVVAAVMVAAVAVNMTGFTYAVSSTAPSKVRDYLVKAAPDKTKVSRAQISVAVTKVYPGARPSVTSTPKPMYPNCYDVRFKYHGKLKRMSFNCSSSKTKLTMATR